jgi:hypothetical protein
LARLSPRDNTIRLTGVVLLAEIYESEGNTAGAAAAYRDVASYSANAEWRSLAAEKLKELSGKK